MRRLIPIFFLLGSLNTPCALATYSIAATDARSGQMGAAVTSCIQGNSLDRVYASSAGKGVILAQALSNPVGRDQAKSLLDAGFAAKQAMDFITTVSFDRFYKSRQYAIVSFSEATTFTGSETFAYAGDISGQLGSLRYAIQGNLLTVVGYFLKP